MTRSGALEPVLELVEAAKEELVAAVPSPRGVPGRPLAAALLAFESRLRQASSLLAGDGERLSNAIDDALDLAERLRLDAPELDYEGLVAVLGDLLAPLDAFEELGQSTRRR